MSLFKAAWRQLRTFCGFGHEATSYLWPRWIVLRAVGVVYVIIFSGILQEGRALVGPRGLVHIADYCALAEQVLPNVFVRVLRVPSLFLINSDPLMISAVQWSGLAAAVALVLNLWPRLALFACWAILVSFVGVWREFSSTLNDPLMLETALLCIPFAPSGIRPGLGVASPPRPITVFMMRWLIIRIMLTAGLIKMFGSDPRWLNFTMMEAMYETSPAPTILAYYVYHLPHACHVFQILFTFAAELLAPVLALFGGRRGRAIAVVIWTIFQLGIQLTGNFAWLNTASIALGLLLLDDQMIVSGFRRLRLGGWAERFAVVARPASALRAPRFVVVGALLWLHFGLTIYFPTVILRGQLVLGLPDPRTDPLQFLFRDFRSANCYSLYATTPPVRNEVEFAGSNDGGATWRSYPFRYIPQREDRMSPFLAPRFGRFEATLQLVLDGGNRASLIPNVAHELLQGNPDVIGLFSSNPFPDASPTIVRMMGYRYTFTNLKTHRDTGQYWNKVYIGDYAPPVTAAQQ
jgi:lipase maturation factor 1